MTRTSLYPGSPTSSGPADLFPSLPAEGSTRPRRAPSVISDSEISAFSDAESSEADEDGVFFGNHDDREADLLARMGTGSSPLSSNSPSTPKRNGRVRKRDSREFIRRKTLSSSITGNSLKPTTPTTEREKSWDGGFYEKGTQRSRIIEEESDDGLEMPPAFSTDLDASPSKRPQVDDHSNLTLDFSKFCISDIAPSPAPVYTEHPNAIPEEVGSENDEEGGSESSVTDEESFDDDSDKENNAVPMSPISSDDPFEIVAATQEVIPIVMGLKYEEALGVSESDDEALEELDMGGLRLADFSDPGMGDEDEYSGSPQEDDVIDFGADSSYELDGPEEADLDEDRVAEQVDLEATLRMPVAEEHVVRLDNDDCDPTTICTGEEESDSLSANCAGKIVAVTIDMELIRLNLTTSTDSGASVSYPIVASQGVFQDDITESPELSSPLVTPPSSTYVPDRDLITPNEQTSPSKSPPTLENQSSSSDELDSPIPVMRGGPVVIPQLSHLAYSIRAETGSPYRALPSSSPQPDSELELVSDTDATIRLPSLDSPTSSATLASRTTPLTPRARIVAAGEIGDQTPPTESPAIGPVGLGPELKRKSPSSNSTTSTHTTVDPPKAVVSAIIDKKTAARAASIRSQLDGAFALRQSAMGPPQRTASGSSSSSAHARPPSRAGQHGTSQKKLATSESSRSSHSMAGSIAPSSAKSRINVSKAPLTASRTGAASTQANARSAAHSAVPAVKKATVISSSRPPLAPRSLPASVVRASAPRSTMMQVSTKVPLVKGVQKVTVNVSPPPITTTNTLKRPLSVSQPTLARSMITTGGAMSSRPTFGPPTRVTSGGSVPAFSIGVGGGEPSNYGTARGSRSPGRMGMPKRLGCSPAVNRKLGTPVRLGTPSQGITRSIGTLGTPSRTGNRTTGTPRRNVAVSRPQSAIQALAPSTGNKAAMTTEFGVGAGNEASQQDGPSSQDAAPTEAPSTTRSGTPIRGSSEDHEDVSFQLPPANSSDQGSSPLSKASSRLPRPVSQNQNKEEKRTPSPEQLQESTASQGTGRLKRVSKVSTTARNGVHASATIVPNMSEKELKATTQRNTSRNEVYHCAIDRQIVRKNGPRPPSPSSKIRTIADRDEADKKAGRGERAKRRSKGSDAENESGTDIPHFPRIERIETVRGPGDDEDYVTPARPSKKAKTSHQAGQNREKEKNVKWDRGLLVHRDDGSIPSKEVTPASEAGIPGRSALRDTSVELDVHGNIVDHKRPQENLKRQRIVVTAVFYDGEEPAPVAAYASTIPPSNTTSSKAKKR